MPAKKNYYKNKQMRDHEMQVELIKVFQGPESFDKLLLLGVAAGSATAFLGSVLGPVFDSKLPGSLKKYPDSDVIKHFGFTADTWGNFSEEEKNTIRTSYYLYRYKIEHPEMDDKDAQAWAGFDILAWTFGGGIQGAMLKLVTDKFKGSITGAEGGIFNMWGGVFDTAAICGGGFAGSCLFILSLRSVFGTRGLTQLINDVVPG